MGNSKEYEEVYVVGGDFVKWDTLARASIYKYDFVYSTNNGTSWSIDSSFSGRLFRLSPTSPGVIWCVVGNKSPYYYGDLVEDSRDFSCWADTLYYSTDHGKTWSIDLSTFKDGAIFEMHWVDPRHGFIAGIEFGNTAYMYRYEAPMESVPIATANSNQLKIFPNPVSSELHIEGGEVGKSIVITDVLGRRYSVDLVNSNTLNVSMLPTGVYQLAVAGGEVIRFLRE